MLGARFITPPLTRFDSPIDAELQIIETFWVSRCRIVVIKGAANEIKYDADIVIKALCVVSLPRM